MENSSNKVQKLSGKSEELQKHPDKSEELRTNHGSGSVVTHKHSADASAMVAPMATAELPEIPIHGNMGISDDSFLTSSISPEGKQEGKRRSRSPLARSESSTASRRRAPSGSGSGKRTLFERGLKSAPKAHRRPSSAPRGHGRPPSPMLPPMTLQIDEPLQSGATGSTPGAGFAGVYERVAQLEQQRAVDRAFTAQILKAVRSLESNFGKAHARLASVEDELHHPRRDFAIRQEIRDTKAQLEQDIIQGHEQVHNSVGPRLAELQAMVAEVQLSVVSFRDKEAQIEKYLVNLDGERPLEGQKV